MMKFAEGKGKLQGVHHLDREHERGRRQTQGNRVQRQLPARPSDCLPLCEMSGMEWCARGFLARGPPEEVQEAADGYSAGGGTRGQTKLAGARKQDDMELMRGILVRGAAEGAKTGAEMVHMGCANAAKQKCTHSMTAVSSIDEMLASEEIPPCLEMVEEGSVLTCKPSVEKEEVREVHDRPLRAQKAECDFEFPPARLDPQTIGVIPATLQPWRILLVCQQSLHQRACMLAMLPSSLSHLAWRVGSRFQGRHRTWVVRERLLCAFGKALCTHRHIGFPILYGARRVRCPGV